MSVPLDELYALRLSLQDYYTEEYMIIRELKYYIIEKRITDQEVINKIIFDFYNHFGINMPIDFIRSITIINLSPLNNNLTSLLSGYNNSLNSLNLDTIDEDDDEDIDSLDGYVDEDVDSLDGNVDEDVDSQDGNVDENVDSENNDISHNEHTQNEEINENNNEQYSTNNSNQSFPQILPSLNSVYPSQNFISSHIFNLQPQPHNPTEFLNSFTSLMNIMNITLNRNTNNENKKVTLDESDFDKITEIVAVDDHKENCSICMMNIKKDNKISKLPCKHIFHTDCINPWLKEYNYKCPICRKECGKAKYHI